MRMIGRHAAAIALAAALVAGPAAAASYGPGVSDTEIKLGSTNPFSGPASAYGTIAKSASAYFDKVNAEQGGVNGRKINFIMRDDGYSPPKTVEQARKLVEQDQVLAMFQNLGTPTNTAIVKYLNAKKVPHLFVATGASKWDQPDKYPWTTGWQPSYQTEAKVYAKYILDNLPDAKVGILYQNDDYGKDYVEGFREGLGDRADDLVQDCLERTLRKADLYTPDTNLRAWMMTMMRNIFINLKRRERLAARYVEATARHARRQHPPGQLDRVFVTEVFALLDELSESERDAVLMVAVDEWTHAEAAAAAGVKVGTLKSRVSRGRGKLRAMAETSSEVSYVA